MASAACLILIKATGLNGLKVALYSSLSALKTGAAAHHLGLRFGALRFAVLGSGGRQWPRQWLRLGRRSRMEVQWEAILKGRRARHTTLREEEEAESGGNLESVVPLRSLILQSCFSVALWNDMDLDSSVRSSFIHTWWWYHFGSPPLLQCSSSMWPCSHHSRI